MQSLKHMLFNGEATPQRQRDASKTWSLTPGETNGSQTGPNIEMAISHRIGVPVLGNYVIFFDAMFFFFFFFSKRAISWSSLFAEADLKGCKL